MEMDIKSLNYCFYVLIAVLAYFSLRRIRNAQKYVLLLANLIFIVLLSGKKSLVIIVICTLVSYFFGLQIEKERDSNKRRAQILMLVNVTINIAILSFFKFFKDSYLLLQNALAGNGIAITDLVSPIGISYYTLTMTAYAIDIYHNKHDAERKFTDYLVFVTYFPSIIQGPINLFKKTAPQFKEINNPDADRIIMGLQRSLWGYIKKIVIADRIGIVVNSILQDENSAGFTLLWAMMLYSFQIYADFSGGIDVIMGVSEILGIKLTENFKSPLTSRSVTEFWQRWHISLGVFMEKYIYYPLVLNRNMMYVSKKIRNKHLRKTFSPALASLVVFIIVGIWHGTGWNYVAYGCYQAFFVSTAVLLAPLYRWLKNKFKIKEESFTWRLFQTVRTFFILTIGRFFIKAGYLKNALFLMRRAFTDLKPGGLHILFDGSMNNYGLDYNNVYLMYLCILILILVDILHEKGIHIREKIMSCDIVFRYSVYLAAVFVIIIFGIYGPEFDSSSFIYAGF